MYEWDWKNLAKQKTAVDQQVSERKAQRARNVPVYGGEFNCFAPEAAWEHAVAQFAAHGLSWSIWSDKSTHGSGSGSDSWGLYNVRPLASPKPDLHADSADDFAKKWLRWDTVDAFMLNPLLQRTLSTAHP